MGIDPKKLNRRDFFDWALAQDADPTTWAGLLDVNLVAAARLTPLVLPHLIQGAPSTLIYLGSGAARNVYAYNAAYDAQKQRLEAEVAEWNARS